MLHKSVNILHNSHFFEQLYFHNYFVINKESKSYALSIAEIKQCLPSIVILPIRITFFIKFSSKDRLIEQVTFILLLNTFSRNKLKTRLSSLLTKKIKRLPVK